MKNWKNGQNGYFCTVNSKKQGELDFLVEKSDGTILPIEVKSGKDYEIHHALGNVLENEQYGIKEAFVLCNENVSVKGRVTYIPVYMTTFIRRNTEVTGDYVLDISALR